MIAARAPVIARARLDLLNSRAKVSESAGSYHTRPENHVNDFEKV